MAAYEAESTRPFWVGGRVGKMPPLYMAAGAKAILSVSPTAQVDTTLSGHLHQ